MIKILELFGGVGSPRKALVNLGIPVKSRGEDMEIWKDIKGYEGLYKVSDIGNVFSINKNIILKKSEDRYGYFYVTLYRQGKGKKIKIHRLVASTFIINEFNKPCVDHIDRNRKNNKLSNLRYVTVKENSNNKDTIHHLKNIGEAYKTKYGKRIQDDKGNNYNSIIEAHRVTGIPRSNIQYHLKNKTGIWSFI